MFYSLTEPSHTISIAYLHTYLHNTMLGLKCSKMYLKIAVAARGGGEVAIYCVKVEDGHELMCFFFFFSKLPSNQKRGSK